MTHLFIEGDTTACGISLSASRSNVYTSGRMFDVSCRRCRKEPKRPSSADMRFTLHAGDEWIGNFETFDRARRWVKHLRAFEDDRRMVISDKGAIVWVHSFE